MGFWTRLFARKQSGSITHPEQIWIELYGSRASKSGVSVNWMTAMQAMAVLACVRVLAEGIAQIPLKLLRESADGKSKIPARDHPLYRILHRRPNDWQTSFQFRETLMWHVALTGNGFAFINRVVGRVVELLPLMPGWVTVRNPRRFEIEYEVRIPNTDFQIIPRSSMLHLRGPSWDSVLGLDATKLAREAIGLSLAAEQQAASLAGHGGRPSGVLSTDVALGPEAVDRVREAWTKAFSAENSNRVAVLEAGYKFFPMAMTSVDAQHIETRRMQVEEICRALRVSPLMVFQADKTATYASAEQFFIAHVIHTLGPWVERWEQTLDHALLSEAEIEEGLFTHLNVNGLMRGDASARATYYSRGILDGWMTRNEAREKEDMNPLDGLDEPLRPLNMGPGSQPPPLEQPKPAPKPKEGDDDDDG